MPDNYGYVVFSTVIGHFAANMYMSFNVMSARKKYNVEYPNLYAVPGYHKEANAFNRVQRGHQNMLETLPLVLCMGFISGVQFPLASIVLNAMHSLGCCLYQIGYADTSYDVTTARFKKGGILKSIAEVGLLVATIRTIGIWNQWW